MRGWLRSLLEHETQRVVFDATIVNAYLYSNASPLKFVDPGGEWVIVAAVAVVAVVGVIAAGVKLNKKLNKSMKDIRDHGDDLSDLLGDDIKKQRAAGERANNFHRRWHRNTTESVQAGLEAIDAAESFGGASSAGLTPRPRLNATLSVAPVPSGENPSRDAAKTSLDAMRDEPREP